VPRVLFALALILAVSLQAAILPQIALLQVRPNFILVLILLWSIARGPREGALWAFGTGIVLDLLSLAPLGAHALALIGVVGVGAVSRTPRFRLGLLLPMLSALAATFVHDTVLLLAQAAGNLGPSLLRLSLPASLLNLISVPLLALIVNWLQHWLQMQEETIGRPRPPGSAGRIVRR
jgi:rod shape-determining protein MreD